MKTINIELGTARDAIVAWMCQDVLVLEAVAKATGQQSEALAHKTRYLIWSDRAADQVEHGMLLQAAGGRALEIRPQ
ncbi:hypothetical protein ABIC83_002380 [Roseateles asaccharophilus]|uniref:hypothetical protein n=1 Tax=Roseateles asaccharophilus TaxID=582607 RepID=UPI003836A771